MESDHIKGSMKKCAHFTAKRESLGIYLECMYVFGIQRIFPDGGI